MSDDPNLPPEAPLECVSTGPEIKAKLDTGTMEKLLKTISSKLDKFTDKIEKAYMTNYVVLNQIIGFLKPEMNMRPLKESVRDVTEEAIEDAIEKINGDELNDSE